MLRLPVLFPAQTGLPRRHVVCTSLPQQRRSRRREEPGRIPSIRHCTPHPPTPTTAAPTAATSPQPTADAPTPATVPTPCTRTTPARSGPMTDDEYHAVTRQYDVVDMRKFTPLLRLPFSTNSDAAVYLGMFLASVKLAMREILTICDESGKQAFDTPPWVKGWHRTLHK